MAQIAAKVNSEKGEISQEEIGGDGWKCGFYGAEWERRRF
jgi:hypothetical protein